MKKIFSIALIAGILFPFPLFAETPITVAEINFKIAILGEEVFYFGFAEGDQLIFNFVELNGKEIKELEIIELPSSSKFIDYKTRKIENKIINVAKTGIYKFRFANTIVLTKNCNLKIQRIAASEATKNFNSTVYWRTVYDTAYRTIQEKSLSNNHYKIVGLLPPTVYFIDRNLASSLFEDKSRITIPIELPENTAEWYYVYSVSRDKEKIEKSKMSINLAAELTKLVGQTGGLTFSPDTLTKPEGKELCRIYLLDYSNSKLFEAKSNFRHYKEGSRENTSSGIVKIKTANISNAFLGIRNPDMDFGIYVALEVVAITSQEKAGLEDAQRVSITARKEAYLKN